MFSIIMFNLIFVGSLSEADDDVVHVDSGYVNIRSEPNGPIIGKVKDGDSLDVQQSNEKGDWDEIKFNGQKAYISNKYIRYDDAKKSTGDLGKVSIDAEHGANLRSKPNLKGEVLLTIPDNAEVKLLGKPVGDWVPIEYEGKKGYVYNASGDRVTGRALDQLLEAEGPCPTCGTKVESKHNNVEDLKKVAKQNEESGSKSVPDKSLLSRWSDDAYASAVRGRPLAKFHHVKNGYRSGNVSKGMCAAGVIEALDKAGICGGHLSGNAYALHQNGSLRRDCKHLRLSSLRDPRTAPAGSVIVYSGYAGKTPHHYGHIESKVIITPEIYAKVRGDVKLRGLKVGQAMYCSDYCRAVPTMTRHNPVAAIYVMD